MWSTLAKLWQLIVSGLPGWMARAFAVLLELAWSYGLVLLALAAVAAMCSLAWQSLRNYLSKLPPVAEEAATRTEALLVSWRSAIRAQWMAITQKIRSAYAKLPPDWWQVPVGLLIWLIMVVFLVGVVRVIATNYGWDQVLTFAILGFGAVVVAGLVWMVLRWLWSLLRPIFLLVGWLIAATWPVPMYLAVGGAAGWLYGEDLDPAARLTDSEWAAVGALVGLAVFVAVLVWKLLRLLFSRLLIIIRKLREVMPIVLTVVWHAALGGVVGLLWGLLTPTIEFTQPHSPTVGIVVGVTIVALSLMLFPRLTRPGRFLCWVGLVAIMIGIWTTYLWDQLPPQIGDYYGDDFRLLTWIVFGIPALFAMLPFLQMANSDRELEAGQVQYSYRRWFHIAFSNLIRVSLAAGFAVIIYALFQLCVELLDIVQFKELAAASRMPPVPFIVVGVAFGLGMVELEYGGLDLYQAIQRVGALVGAGVLAVLTLFVLSYLSILPFAGLEPLWETEHATPILLVVTGAMALALNLVRGDGFIMLQLPRWLRYGVELALALLPIFPAIAMYSVLVRVEQYGLTPERMWAMVLSGVALAYSLGVAASVWHRRGEWLSSVNRINLTLAALAVPLVLTMHSPWLDPIRWSVNSQADRLLEERVSFEEFDYGVLRRGLGQVGWSKFAELEQLQDHPRAAMIRGWFSAYVQDTAAGKPWPPSRRTIGPNSVRLLQPGRGMPPELRSALQRDSGRLAMCHDEGVECIAVAADIIVGEEKEYCVVMAFDSEVHPSQSLCYAKHGANGSWSRFGQLLGGRTIPLHEFAAALQGGNTNWVPPRTYRRVRVGEHVFDVVPILE